MSYRDDLQALAARTEALEHEVDARGKELADARRLLDEAQARARLPILDNIKVAAPCTAPWDEMTGDDRVRHCGQCKLDVFNLSAMTRDEAEALLRETTGRLCVRYFRRHDGTIITADCPVGTRRRRKRRVIAAGAAALLAGGGAAAFALAHRDKAERLEPPTITVPTVALPSIPPPPVAVQRGIGPEPQPPPVEVKGDIAPSRDMPEMGQMVIRKSPPKPHPVEIKGKVSVR
ncbi:MAG TPA: hypothetical protein VLX92_13580 [Kofleriaceae bacterium]|nr:hypothetical protein [Kofleriaceae bacterium]